MKWAERNRGGGDEDEVRILLRGPDLADLDARVAGLTEDHALVLYRGGQAPVLPLGLELECVLQAVRSGSRLSRRVRLVAREDATESRCYEVSFLQSQKERELLAAFIARAFNARQAYRVTPGDDKIVVVEAAPPDLGKHLRGRLLDISATGMALLLDLGADADLARHAILQTRIYLPGALDPASLRARILARRLQTGGLVYHMAFIDDGSAAYDRASARITNYVMDRQRAQIRNRKED